MHASYSLLDMVEELSLKLEEKQALNNQGTTSNVRRGGHVTAIHETACKEIEWHITRLPKTSAKACFAQQDIPKKKCEAKIIHGKKPTGSPTYSSVMQNSHKKNKDKARIKLNTLLSLEIYNWSSGRVSDLGEQLNKATKTKWRAATSRYTPEMIDSESIVHQIARETLIGARN